jgi:hypothetical protein
MSERRNFKVVETDIGDIGGHYKGKTPSQAARKAASVLSRNNPDEDVFTFTIQETTRGSRRDAYVYTATIEHLEDPIEVTYGNGSSITITKKVHLKANGKREQEEEDSE